VVPLKIGRYKVGRGKVGRYKVGRYKVGRYKVGRCKVGRDIRKGDIRKEGKELGGYLSRGTCEDPIVPYIARIRKEGIAWGGCC
jgi:hypothetical protein